MHRSARRQLSSFSPLDDDPLADPYNEMIWYYNTTIILVQVTGANPLV